MKTYQFLLVKCEYLVFLVYDNDSKLNIFGFWTVGQTKQDAGRSHLGLSHPRFFSDILQTKQLFK